MLATITVSDIQSHYNLGERDFPKSQLRRVDLRNANLRGINFQGSDLSYADLRDADLSNADLSNCYLNEANLSGAKLAGANLQGTHLIKAYLTKTNFSKANLKESYFTGSFLTKANLSKADLSGSILTGTHLNGAIFMGALYDHSTRFDRGFEPESLGMSKVSSFQGKVAKKVTIVDIINNFESIATITSRYLGGTITAKHFADSRPDVSWLEGFNMDKNGKINFTGSINQQATMIQLKWFEKWTNAFVQKCSIIIQDLPDIIQEKHLTVDYLIKNNAA